MQNLIQTNTTALTMSSKEIADRTGKLHKHVIRDIREILEGIEGPNLDPKEYQEVRAANGMTAEIRLNYRLCTLLITGYSVPHRLRVIDRWQELEAQAVAGAFEIPKTRADALRLAADLDERVKELEAHVEVLEPQAEIHDRLIQSDDDLTVTDAAKIIGLGRDYLFKWMAKNRWVYRRNDSGPWVPYQKMINCGYLTVREHLIGDRAKYNVVVTQKGLAALAHIFPQTQH